MTAVFILAGVLYALLGPRWYRSTLTVVPAKPQQGGGLGGALGGQLGGLASALDLGATTEAPRIAAVLQSVAVSDAVIEKFGLRQRYDEKFEETARKELWRHCEVKTLPKPGLVELSCEDRDPRFAQQMLEYFAEYGNQVFRRVSVGSATEEVRYLEKRVTELRQQAADASTRMRTFQEQHGIVDIDTQSRAVVSAIAALNSEKISKQMELDLARSYASPDEPTAQQIESELSVVEQKLGQLERSRGAAAGGKGKQAGMFPAALDVPKLRAEFEQLYRDRKVAELSLVFSLQRLEAARASEARDVSTFQVLDPPTLPTRKSRPKGSMVVLSMALLGLAVSIACEWWRSGRGAALLAEVFGSARQ